MITIRLLLLRLLLCIQDSYGRITVSTVATALSLWNLKLQRRSPIHPTQVFTTLHLVYRVYNELSTVQSLLIAACSLYQSLARTCSVCQLRKLCW